MTQQNGSNGHSSHPLPPIPTDNNLPASDLETSAISNPTNDTTGGEAVKSPTSREAELILTPNGSNEANERAPSYIPLSTNTSSSQVTQISSDIQKEASKSIEKQEDKGAAIDSALDSAIDSLDQQANENTEAASTVAPEIPPHKSSPNGSNDASGADNTSVSTPCEPSNVTKVPEQTVASNENGAIPKPKPNKPRSRNRHKR